MKETIVNEDHTNEDCWWCTRSNRWHSNPKLVIRTYTNEQGETRIRKSCDHGHFAEKIRRKYKIGYSISIYEYNTEFAYRCGEAAFKSESWSWSYSYSKIEYYLFAKVSKSKIDALYHEMINVQDSCQFISIDDLLQISQKQYTGKFRYIDDKGVNTSIIFVDGLIDQVYIYRSGGTEHRYYSHVHDRFIREILHTRKHVPIRINKSLRNAIKIIRSMYKKPLSQLLLSCLFFENVDN